MGPVDEIPNQITLPCWFLVLGALVFLVSPGEFASPVKPRTVKIGKCILCYLDQTLSKEVLILYQTTKFKTGQN